MVDTELLIATMISALSNMAEQAAISVDFVKDEKVEYQKGYVNGLEKALDYISRVRDELRFAADAQRMEEFERLKLLNEQKRGADNG